MPGLSIEEFCGEAKTVMGKMETSRSQQKYVYELYV